MYARALLVPDRLLVLSQLPQGVAVCLHSRPAGEQQPGLANVRDSVAEALARRSQEQRQQHDGRRLADGVARAYELAGSQMHGSRPHRNAYAGSQHRPHHGRVCVESLVQSTERWQAGFLRRCPLQATGPTLRRRDAPDRVADTPRAGSVTDATAIDATREPTANLCAPRRPLISANKHVMIVNLTTPRKTFEDSQNELAFQWCRVSVFLHKSMMCTSELLKKSRARAVTCESLLFRHSRS